MNKLVTGICSMLIGMGIGIIIPRNQSLRSSLSKEERGYIRSLVRARYQEIWNCYECGRFTGPHLKHDKVVKICNIYDEIFINARPLVISSVGPGEINRAIDKEISSLIDEKFCKGGKRNGKKD